MKITTPYTLKWLQGGSDINAASTLIRRNYNEIYHATLPFCMPWLLCLYDNTDELKAACGVQLAGLKKLFLEHYLNEPIERILSSRINHPVQRTDIIEIGNFAACDGASTRIMYGALCHLLNHYHYSWIVFTGTKKIRNTFSRLNLSPIPLAPADPERIDGCVQTWGEYYRHDPIVMAGELSGGQLTLSRTTRLLNLFPLLPDAPWINQAGDSYVS
jgi:hypothetical protein